MDLSKKLKDQGWHLTDDGIKKVIAAAAPGAEADVRKIIATAMDMDFRDIAAGALPPKREDTLPGRVVLQVQKIRNISAPKANEESKSAPRFLQLDLTDGHAGVQALELDPVPALNLNVPPGTKIYFRAERMTLMQGFIVLKSDEVQILGGRVDSLVEKWELARTMQKYARSGRRMSGASGPPPWIAFGKKMEVTTTLPNERNFKSLQGGLDKDKDTKENEEFNAMRSEAIAEATKAGARKIFGGGGQQILDHNVKKILEKGYSEEEAKLALRTTNNNLERALYNLKRRQDYKRYDEPTRSLPPDAPAALPVRTGRGGSSGRELGGGKRGAATAKEEAAAPKPAGNVSLFDFLTDKLPANAETTAAATTTTSTSTHASSSANTTSNQKYDKPKPDYNKSSYSSAQTKPPDAANSSRPKFENNISSSFAANRNTGERSSQRGGRRGETGPSTRGRGGGRGGGGSSGYQSNNRAMQEDSSSGGGYAKREESRSGGMDRNAPRGSSTNYNQGGTSNRNSRSSHERSAGSERNGQEAVAGGSSYSGNRRGGGGSSGGERYGNYGEQKTRYNQRDNNNRGGYESNRQPNNNNAANARPNNNSSEGVNKLVEATSKLKIDNKREQATDQSRNRHQPQQQQYSQTHISHQQQQQQQQHYVPPPQQQQQYMSPQQANQNFTQLPNGFTYDPSKIIGFQNKETNEFAMTLLKSQGMNAPPPAGQQQTQPPPPQLQSPPLAASAYIPAVSPMQAPPSPYAAAPTYILNNPQGGGAAAVPVPVAAPPTHFGMVPGDAWLWKPGDLCLAKYWDDGRYYEAEITAVSDKTCVVFFLGYGNHEEVLKSDCLPITDANHRPINNYNQAPLPPQQQQQQMQAYQRGGGGGAVGGNAAAQRYRGERQMYVPPHKRDN